MELTHQNYHSLENRNLTNSRIGDFLRCKKYFYDRHISGEIQQKDKDCFKVGQGVDVWLTNGKEQFMKKFVAVTRRNLKNPPTNYTELTQLQYDEIVNMCEVLEVQPAYKELNDHDKQVIIQYDIPIGEHFSGLSFICDWLKIEGDTTIITDLKTANDTNEFKHHRKCEEYGYYRQFALATDIIQHNNPEVKNFIYRHLVIDKSPDGINIPYAFQIDNERVELVHEHLFREIIPMIANEKEFKAKQVTWENAPIIGRVEEF